MPEQPSINEQQASKSSLDQGYIDQVQHIFDLEHMTAEQVLQLSTTLELQYQAARESDRDADSGLLLALENEVEALPTRNLAKAHEIIGALALSEHGHDRMRAAAAIGNLVCVDNPGDRYEDSNGARAIQLWLHLILDNDPDAQSTTAESSVTDAISAIGMRDNSESQTDILPPHTASLIVTHLADLLRGEHPYLRYVDGELIGGILGSSFTTGQ